MHTHTRNVNSTALVTPINWSLCYCNWVAIFGELVWYKIYSSLLWIVGDALILFRLLTGQFLVYSVEKETPISLQGYLIQLFAGNLFGYIYERGICHLVTYSIQSNINTVLCRQTGAFILTFIVCGNMLFYAVTLETDNCCVDICHRKITRARVGQFRFQASVSDDKKKPPPIGVMELVSLICYRVFIPVQFPTPGMFLTLDFRLEYIRLIMLPSDSFMSNLHSPIGYSIEDFQAFVLCITNLLPVCYFNL